MTVSTLTNRVVYPGNGAATQFAVPFKVLDVDHLVVTRRVAATDAVEYTYVGTDYSYVGLGDDAGTLTLNGAALSSTYELVIERTVPYTQDADLVNQGGFYPETVEEQLDLIVMQIQQVAARPDLLTEEALAQDALNATQAAFDAAASAAQAVASAATAASERARIAALSAAFVYDAPARDLIAGEAEGLAIDCVTETVAEAAYVKDLTTPANDFEGSIRDWLTAAGITAFPAARDVTLEDGTAGSSTHPGSVPYDWSQGERRLLIDANDDFELPTTKFPALKSFYMEFGIDTVGAAAEQVAVELANSADATETLFIARLPTSPPIYYQATTFSDATSSGATIGVEDDLMLDDVISLAIRLEDNKIAISASGEPVIFDPRRTAPGSDRIRLGGNFTLPPNHKLYLRRLIALPRLLTDNELCAWQGAASRLHPHVRSAAMICPHAGHIADGAERAREPVVRLLHQDDTSAALMAMHMEKWGDDADGHHIEAPARLNQYYFEVDKATLAISPSASISIVNEEQANWGIGKGHLQSPLLFKRSYGTRKGRLFMLWSALESANETFVPSELRNIRMKYSDKNGKAGYWSAAVEVVAGDTFPGEYLIPGPNSNVVEFPQDSVYAGRVAFVAYTGSGPRIVYSDDPDGLVWTVGAEGVAAGYWPNESTIALLPNDQLLVTSRLMTSPGGLDVNDDRAWFLSSDGGANMVHQGMMTGFTGAAVAGSMVQVDPAGGRGTYGRLALARASFTSGLTRHGCLITHHEEDGLAPVDTFQALARFRELGYCDIVPLWGGTHYALVQESSVAGFNNWSSCVLAIVEAPARAVTP